MQMHEEKSQIGIVKEYFDQHAQDWSDLYQKSDNVADMILQNRKDISLGFLCKYLKPGSEIFDAGCGAGVISLDLAEKGFVVHGMDISKKMLDLCEDTFCQRGIDPSKYRFTVGNVIDSDFPKHSFDGIVCLGFLEYQEDEYKVLDKFRQMLRPGGLLVLSGPIKIRLSNLFGLTEKRLRGLSINRYSLSRFKALLEPSDFNLLEYKRHGYAHFRVPRLFRILIRLIGGERVLHQLLTGIATFLPVDRFANDMVVVAIKKEGA